MTAEERATPLAQLGAAARSRIAEAAGVSVRDVGEALGKYEWTRAAMARMAQLKAEGKPIPTNFEDLETSLGGGWRQQASAAAAAAAQGAPPPRAAAPPLPPRGGGGGGQGPTLMMHGRRVTAAAAESLPSGVTKNGPCPCGSGNKYKRCCGGKK